MGIFFGSVGTIFIYGEAEMTEIFDRQPKSFEEAIDLVNSSPTLRKIKSQIDNTELSADMKAILYDIANVTVKIGESVIAAGRRIFEIATALCRA